MKYLITFILLAIGTLSFGQVNDSTYIRWVDGVNTIKDHPDSIINYNPNITGPSRYENLNNGDFYYYDRADSVFYLWTPHVDTFLPNDTIVPKALHSLYFNSEDSSYWRNFNMTDSSWIQLSN